MLPEKKKKKAYRGTKRGAPVIVGNRNASLTTRACACARFNRRMRRAKRVMRKGDPRPARRRGRYEDDPRGNERKIITMTLAARRVHRSGDSPRAMDACVRAPSYIHNCLQKPQFFHYTRRNEYRRLPRGGGSRNRAHPPPLSRSTILRVLSSVISRARSLEASHASEILIISISSESTSLISPGKYCCAWNYNVVCALLTRSSLILFAGSYNRYIHLAVYFINAQFCYPLVSTLSTRQYIRIIECTLFVFVSLLSLPLPRHLASFPTIHPFPAFDARLVQ